MAETEAQKRAKQKYRRKGVESAILAADLARGYIEIKEHPATETGKRRFYIELVAPQSVQDALAVYCERQGIEVADYLEDVGRELLLAAGRK